VYRKVALRLVPLLCLCYVAAYLDRVNAGFAKLQMLSDLSFSNTIYGLGAGIFFVDYVLFDVPSNIILHRVGAKLWIARIMITWGLIAAAMAFVKTRLQFADHAAMARVFGMHAQRVERLDDLDAAINKAMQNLPALLDVIVSPGAKSSEAKTGLAWVPDLQPLGAWDEAERRLRE